MANQIPQKQGKTGYKSPPKETQFKPGQSGNPGGLPRGTPKVSLALMKLLAGSPNEKFTPSSRAEQIALALYTRASNGEVSAIKEIADRTEGKSPATLNINPDDKQRWQEMAQRLAEKYNKPQAEVVRDIIERRPEAMLYLQEWLM